VLVNMAMPWAGCGKHACKCPTRRPPSRHEHDTTWARSAVAGDMKLQQRPMRCQPEAKLVHALGRMREACVQVPRTPTAVMPRAHPTWARSAVPGDMKLQRGPCVASPGPNSSMPWAHRSPPPIVVTHRPHSRALRPYYRGGWLGGGAAASAPASGKGWAGCRHGL
jgi:hypothetical protein